MALSHPPRPPLLPYPAQPVPPPSQPPRPPRLRPTLVALPRTAGAPPFSPCPPRPRRPPLALARISGPPPSHPVSHHPAQPVASRSHPLSAGGLDRVVITLAPLPEARATGQPVLLGTRCRRPPPLRCAGAPGRAPFHLAGSSAGPVWAVASRPLGRHPCAADAATCSLFWACLSWEGADSVYLRSRSALRRRSRAWTSRTSERGRRLPPY